jgi:hypothetical protein
MTDTPRTTAKRRRKADPLRCLNKSECAWCSGSLRQAARGNCGGIYADTREACWWVPTIRDYGPAEALRMSLNNKRDGARKA